MALRVESIYSFLRRHVCMHFPGKLRQNKGRVGKQKVRNAGVAINFVMLELIRFWTADETLVPEKLWHNAVTQARQSSCFCVRRKTKVMEKPASLDLSSLFSEDGRKNEEEEKVGAGCDVGVRNMKRTVDERTRRKRKKVLSSRRLRLHVSNVSCFQLAPR